jgi:hypothetical protein
MKIQSETMHSHYTKLDMYCFLYVNSETSLTFASTYASNFPYVFHIKLWFFQMIIPEVNSCPILIIVLSTKAEKYAVYNGNFQITVRSLYFRLS